MIQARDASTGGAAVKKRRAPSCFTCRHRQWRQIDGFMVLGCPLHVMRFGIMPDLKRGRVNKAGNCVPMPRQCREYA